MGWPCTAHMPLLTEPLGVRGCPLDPFGLTVEFGCVRNEPALEVSCMPSNRHFSLKEASDAQDAHKSIGGLLSALPALSLLNLLVKPEMV